MKIESHIVKLTLLLFAAILAIILSTAAQAQEKPVRVVWDPPEGEEVQRVDGYNVYRVTITPMLRPADYDVNLTTPLAPEYTMAYQKLNTELIPKGTFEFTIEKATPGFQTIVRAYSKTWDVESPDSDVLTLRDAPGKVQGHKVTALVLESSVDLQKWVQRAVYELAFVAPTEVFRLRW